MPDSSPALRQTVIGAGTLLVGAVMAFGASTIPSAAGYAGVGPNFLPWLVSIVLIVCGALLVWEASSGGFRGLDEPSGAAHGDWTALAWVSAGVLANAALITVIGFVFSCALCFVLAVRGLRASEGRPAGGVRQTAIDAVTGLAIAAPCFWLFTKLLSINLPGVPGITANGWL